MPKEFPKAYEPKPIEERWAQAWVEQKLFRAEQEGRGPVFSIVLPPPNITGSIHIGHMLEHTQIDILARWRRMSGFRTLWLPGLDHAGIATQVVVERDLAELGLTRLEIGREEFERRVWRWKAESGDTIKKQMIRLGASCDWTRERFTLDPPLYRAVLEAFLRLYREGLIYRGRYMVNWCPRCQTALSDLETEHHEREDMLWFVRYPLADSEEFLEVATTRPETMLGDTAVAAHPDDKRYQRFVGRHVRLPLMNRQIPVIADSYVDPEFGTGVVKITPAHDPNDFEIGRRHSLPEIDVMTDDGIMNENAGPYKGLNRFGARYRVLDDLEKEGLYDARRTSKYIHVVPFCQRCKTEVEPRLSIQWFLKMKPLAEPAANAIRDGLILIVPENWQKVYLDWMDRIHDWCISRQLWWGHRIPIWHCGECGAMMPARDSRVEVVNDRAQAASVPEKCDRCGSTKLAQDPDVLDTWFSSGLWPFSTLGWPDETEDLKTFYPTSLLISGYDILFFWDARMIMLGLHLVPRPKIEERIPFRKLYLHAIVRDPHGMKMSKTRGNVMDPLEVTEQHGTDALRFALTVMAAPGTDIALSEERILSYRAFANKIWNAARFLFVNFEKVQATGITLAELAAPEIRAQAPYASKDGCALAHRWIFSRLADAISQINDALENFRFHEAAHVIYHFFWGDFCDWYIEWLKPHLATKDREATVIAWRNLFAVFEAALRLLHPFMPFLTEELWHRLPQRAGARSIALDSFPRADAKWADPEAEEEFALLQGVIIAARNIRAERKIDPKQKVSAEYGAENPFRCDLVRNNVQPILRLAGLANLRIQQQRLKPATLPMHSGAEFDLRLDTEATMDRQKEIHRLRKKIEWLAKDIQSKQDRLADTDFRTRAPTQVVQNLGATMVERQLERKKLEERLAQLEESAGAAP